MKDQVPHPCKTTGKSRKLNDNDRWTRESYTLYCYKYSNLCCYKNIIHMVLLHICQHLPLPGSLASHYLCHKHWSHDSAHLDILSTFIAYTDINTFKTGAGMHLVIWRLKPRNFCLYWHIFKKQQFISYFFSCSTVAQNRPWPPHSWGFLDHTRRCTTAASVMSHWHIHCVHMADHVCIVVLGRSHFWIPILGQVNPF